MTTDVEKTKHIDLKKYPVILNHADSAVANWPAIPE